MKVAIIMGSKSDYPVVQKAEDILKHFNVCPWDYSMWPDHIGGVIRLAFGPLWFCTGLLFEMLQTPGRLENSN